MIARMIAALRKKAYGIVVSLLLIPIVGGLIHWMIVDRVIDRIRGPDSYKIYIVGDFEQSAAERIYEEFVKPGSLNTIDGTRLEVRTENDEGDPIQAQRIASELVSRSDTLLVVGHIASTQTKAALPSYLDADPPVPVILTTETNPNLTPPKLDPDLRYPIFRLSPTDIEQARTAAQLVVAEHAESIWVVKDTENPVYSDFLAREFIRQVEQEHGRVLLVSNNSNVPNTTVVKALNIDWVFFAGDRQGALVLVRQLRKIFDKKIPGIILSDASVDERLIVDGGPDISGIYLTCPMSVKEHNDERGVGIYGERAREVVDRLIDLTEAADSTEEDLGFWYRLRRLLHIRRVEDARRLLGSVMKNAQAGHKRFPVADDISIEFGVRDGEDDGTRVDSNANFRIWRVSDGQFVDSEQIEEKPFLKDAGS